MTNSPLGDTLLNIILISIVLLLCDWLLLPLVKRLNRAVGQWIARYLFGGSPKM